MRWAVIGNFQAKKLVVSAKAAKNVSGACRNWQCWIAVKFIFGIHICESYYVETSVAGFSKKIIPVILVLLRSVGRGGMA